MTYPHLDLFSGIGGFSLGVERGGLARTVAFAEQNKFCQRVLAEHWQGIPIYNDVKEVTSERLRADSIEFPQIITAGWPCQDFSVAGNQRGMEGLRSGLWSEVARTVCDFRPRYVLLENVAALTSGDRGRWFGRVVGDLAALRYDCEWYCISAAMAGASHKRERIWVIAYPRHTQPQGRNETSSDNNRCSGKGQSSWSESTSPRCNVGDTEHDGSPTTTLTRGTTQASDNDTQGQDATSQLEGTGGSWSGENVADPPSAGLSKRRQPRRDKSNQEAGTGVVAGTERCGDVADSKRQRPQGQGKSEPSVSTEAAENRETGGIGSECQPRKRELVTGMGLLAHGIRTRLSRSGWLEEPRIGRIAERIPDRKEKLTALGNSLVPIIPQIIAESIVEYEARKENGE